MNLKRLIVASVALAALSPGVWADDVTDTYLVNPSFEILKAKDGTTDVSLTSNLTNGLYGWEVDDWSGIDYSTWKVESYAGGSSSGFGSPITPSNGTYYYFNRRGWLQGSVTTSKLKTTTTVAVPAGRYYFVVDYKAGDWTNSNDKSAYNKTTLGLNVYGSDGNTILANLPAAKRSFTKTTAGGTSPSSTYLVDASWKEMGIIFDVSNEQKLTFEIVQNLCNDGRSDVVYDNCRLIQVDENIDIKGMIANYDFEQQNANGWTNGSIGTGDQYADATNNYYQKVSEESKDMYQTITLPAGVYQVKAATRASSSIAKAYIYTSLDDSYDSETYSTDIKGLGTSDGDLGNGWGWTTVEFVVPEESSVKLGFYSECESEESACADTYSLTYLRSVGTEDLASLYAKKVAKAQSVIDSKSDDRAEKEKAALEAKMNATPTSYDDIAALKDLVDRYEYAVDNADEIAEAEAVQKVKDSYSYSYESLLSSDLTTWEKDDFVTMNSNQHWSDAEKYKYYEQSYSEWSGTAAWSHHAEQSVVLPQGKYAMFIAARASSDVTSTMSVKVGDNAAVTETLPSLGDTGRGIDTSGNATYAYDATYANKNVGRGWKYKYIAFEVTGEEQTVVVSFDASAAGSQYQWVSIANPLLYGTVNPNVIYLNKISPLAEELSEYKDKKMSASVWKTCSEDIEKANSATVDSDQSELEALITSLTADIENAKASVAIYSSIETTITTEKAKVSEYCSTDVVSSFESAISDIQKSLDEGKISGDGTTEIKAIKNARLTTILAQTTENAVMTNALENPSFESGKDASWQYVTTLSGWVDCSVKEPQNAPNGSNVLNMWSQNVTKIEVWQKVVLPAGKYKLTVDARTDSEPISSTDTQLRTYMNYKNTSCSEGLKAVEGTWNADSSPWTTLSTTFNIVASTEVEMGMYSKGSGTGTNGWYQIDNFQLIRLGDPDTKYTRTVNNKFGSLCLPHASSETSGIAKLYKITEVTSTTVTVEEQEEIKLDAGYPYLFQKESDATEISVTYTGNPVPDAVNTDTYLVGSLSDFTVPAGNYVLQNDEFRVVKSEDFKVDANRAYLKGTSSSSAALRISFDNEGATGIRAVEALTGGKATIYDLNGRKLDGLRKGINIVDGVKVFVK
jgi:hypothetical protein